MNLDHINAIAVQCLEHAAESKLSPAAAAAECLRQLLSSSVFTADEVNAATLKVTRIIGGIAGRQGHEHAL